MGLRDWIALPRQMRDVRVHYLPGREGERLRYKYWRSRVASMGQDVKIGSGAWFANPQHVTLDDGCWIDRNVTIMAGVPAKKRLTKVKENPAFPLQRGEVYIGKVTHISRSVVLSGHGGMYIGARCGIASNSTVYSLSHHYRNLVDPTDPRQYSFTPLGDTSFHSTLTSPVYIEDDCAVGLNSVILPGTHLKRGTWVASGSVVHGTHGPQVLVNREAGVPDKPLDLRLPGAAPPRPSR